MFGAVFGASTLTAMVAIGIATIPSFARVIRSGALQVMRTEYVMAARSAGRRHARPSVRHVLPNVCSLLIVQASVSFAIAVLAEAALSFLGLRHAAADAVLGPHAAGEPGLLFIAPRLLAFWPGAAIAVAVLGFNLLGDGLRDRFDPRLDDRREHRLTATAAAGRAPMRRSTVRGLDRHASAAEARRRGRLRRSAAASASA